MKKAPRPAPRPSPPAAVPEPVRPGPELLRRTLLGLVTALVVARPLVLGEDPGLTDWLSDASGLVMTLLWLVAAAGWAAWRAWSGRTTWRGSAVELGLLGVVVLAFASAGAAAGYKHPAWLIAWEWAVFLVVFCLVRQLFWTPGESRRLLAAMLGVAVALSVQGIYQYTVELPRLRASLGSAHHLPHWPAANDKVELPRLGASLGSGSGSSLGLKSDTERLRRRLSAIGIYLEPDDPQLKVWDDRFHDNNIFATFAHPNSFAGYLALLLPATVAGTIVCRRRQASGLQTGLTAGCAVLMATALWFTHSRGAVLGSLLVGGAALAIAARRQLWKRKRSVSAALAGILALVSVLYFSGTGKRMGPTIDSAIDKAKGSLALRSHYWIATWAMIKDHRWLGVGPGNFGRIYPRYMLPAAYEKVKDPHDFALEIWVTCGVFALAAFLFALVALAWKLSRSLKPGIRAADNETPIGPDEGVGLHWESYLGGLAGLILAFVLWASGQSGPQAADALLVGGFTAAFRGLVWFLAFVLLERIPWTTRSLAFGLTAGLAALLLNLTVSGGISFPSVAQPMWVVAALALNALPQAAGTPAKATSWLKLALPVPLSLAACVVYFAWIFSPVMRSAALQNEARTNGTLYSHNEELPEGKRLGQPYGYLKSRVIKPLEEAGRADTSDTAPRLELAHWYEERFLAFETRLEEDQDLKRAVTDVERLDPEGTEGYLAEYRMWLLFAGRAAEQPEKKYALAAKAMEEAVKRDPTEARMHYDLADVLFKAKDMKRARQEAQIAFELDKYSTFATRKLSRQQWNQVVLWGAMPFQR